jgi:hypothetical protein
MTVRVSSEDSPKATSNNASLTAVVGGPIMVLGHLAIAGFSPKSGCCAMICGEPLMTGLFHA